MSGSGDNALLRVEQEHKMALAQSLSLNLMEGRVLAKIRHLQHVTLKHVQVFYINTDRYMTNTYSILILQIYNLYA